MNKLRVIDLLNKIANGEIPKKIIYDDKQWTYDEKLEDYITYDDSRIDWKYTIMDYINDEIEIIEKDKKIEKLLMIDGTANILLAVNQTRRKINEILDKLNKEE